MEKSRKELKKLRKKLFNLMVDFGLRALKTYQTVESEPLNPARINKILAREMKTVIGEFSDPSFVDR